MTPSEQKLPIAYIRECMDCDDDGVLRWKLRPAHHFASQRAHSFFNSHRRGAIAGKIVGGYRVVTILWDDANLALLAHRVVWALHFGEWPRQVIDHINRVKTDNRITNLRDVSQDENLRNNGNPNGTGLLGAYARNGKFIAQIKHEGRYRYLGTFATAIEAHHAFTEFRGAQK